MTAESGRQRPGRRYDNPGAGTHEAVVAHVPAGTTVLELGCAGGAMSRMLHGKGCRVVGVERDPDGAAAAAAYLERLVCGDLEDVDTWARLDGGQFDVIVAADVLEHLAEPERALAHCARLLAPNGRLVTSIPNVAHGAVRLTVLGGDFPYADYGILDRTHLRFYTRDTMVAMLRSSGFEPEIVHRTVVPIDESLVSIEESRLPSGIRAWVEQQDEADTLQFIAVSRLVAQPASPRRPQPGASPSAGTAAGLTEMNVLRAQSELIHELEGLVAQLRSDVVRLQDQLALSEAETERPRAAAVHPPVETVVRRVTRRLWRRL